MKHPTCTLLALLFNYAFYAKFLDRKIIDHQRRQCDNFCGRT